MVQALLESMRKGNHTHLLIRRVAGALLRSLLLLCIAHHVELFNTLLQLDGMLRTRSKLLNISLSRPRRNLLLLYILLYSQI